MRGPQQSVASSRGFTLTELLIVIAIIAVLAALITAAAVNALRAANRARIILEIQEISKSIEAFKTDYGAYPPNGMNGAAVGSRIVPADLVRMFKTAFPRHQEHKVVIEALAGIPAGSGTALTSSALGDGMRASEALFFWLGGFSSDEQYPLSGPGGPAFIVGDGEILEDRLRRFEFDLTRIGPRNDDGTFDDGGASGGGSRFITYKDPQNPNVIRRINFWQYSPRGSEQPFIYFDVSRHKPLQYDMPAMSTAAIAGTPWIIAFKQLREGVPAIGGNARNIAFVNQGKFQIFHAGLDDIWCDHDGDDHDTFQHMSVPEMQSEGINGLLTFPQGPFIGAIADTLTNFTDGELADAAEE